MSNRFFTALYAPILCNSLNHITYQSKVLFAWAINSNLIFQLKWFSSILFRPRPRSLLDSIKELNSPFQDMQMPHAQSAPRKISLYFQWPFLNLSLTILEIPCVADSISLKQPAFSHHSHLCSPHHLLSLLTHEYRHPRTCMCTHTYTHTHTMHTPITHAHL